MCWTVRKLPLTNTFSRLPWNCPFLSYLWGPAYILNFLTLVRFRAWITLPVCHFSRYTKSWYKFSRVMSGLSNILMQRDHNNTMISMKMTTTNNKQSVSSMKGMVSDNVALAILWYYPGFLSADTLRSSTSATSFFLNQSFAWWTQVKVEARTSIAVVPAASRPPQLQQQHHSHPWRRSVTAGTPQSQTKWNGQMGVKGSSKRTRLQSLRPHAFKKRGKIRIGERWGVWIPIAVTLSNCIKLFSYFFGPRQKMRLWHGAWLLWK